jgi:hypothetical protein
MDVLQENGAQTRYGARTRYGALPPPPYSNWEWRWRSGLAS